MTISSRNRMLLMLGAAFALLPLAGCDDYYDGPRGYGPPPPPYGYYDRDGYYDDRYYDDRRYGDRYYGDRDPYATDYDAARYYRDERGYGERRLSRDDYVYRGSDGRYYCRRSDGTTGLVIGAIGGGAIGNIIDGGHNRVAGKLIGGALGALAGRAIDQDNSDVRCR